MFLLTASSHADSSVWLSQRSSFKPSVGHAEETSERHKNQEMPFLMSTQNSIDLQTLKNQNYQHPQQVLSNGLLMAKRLSKTTCWRV